MNYSDANTILKKRQSQIPNLLLIPLLSISVLQLYLSIPVLVLIISKIYITSKSTYYFNHKEIIIDNNETNRNVSHSYIFNITPYQTWWMKIFNIGWVLLDVRQHEHYEVVTLKYVPDFIQCMNILNGIEFRKDEYGYDHYVIMD